MSLKGTIYIERGTGSIATVQESGYSETDVYREGDQIIGQDGASIARIERQRVVINNNGTKECIELDKSAKSSSSSSASAPPPLPVEVDPAANQGGGPGGTVTLEEQYVQEELGEGYGNIIQKARLVPNTTDNQMNGFKIFAIAKKSLLRAYE